MTAPRLRSDLESIPAYKPGKAPAPSETPAHKLSSNENPYPPLPAVATAIAECIGGINRYPDMAGREITALIAERFAVEPAQVVLGSGSVEIVSQLMRATAGQGDEVMFAWRSFEAYPLLARAGGAVPVAVPLDSEHRHDLDAMLAAITPRTRLILVCNPNNPTGTTVSSTTLDAFLSQVPSDIVVVLDEAYLHFNHDPESPVGIEFFRRYPNVVLSHTFSKAYGLAGLRIGYAIAPAHIAEALRKVAIPFGVTQLAQIAAVASFRAEDELAVRIDELVAERDRITQALTAMGWSLPESHANFVWFPLGTDTMRGVEVFERHGLLVRPFPGEGMRVSIGSAPANNTVLTAAAELASLVLIPADAETSAA